MLKLKKPKENIIFLHLPKTGGTTLRQLFYSQYSYLKLNEIYTVNRTRDTPIFEQLSSDKKEHIKVLVGHFSYGIHKHFKKPFSYVSFMREPIKRILSAYNYAKTNSKHDFYKEINEHNLEPVAYLKNPKKGWLENGQTKYFAGVSDFNKPCTEETFQMAIKNIENHFLYIGILEDFEKSLLLLNKTLNWQFKPYKIQNKSYSNSLVLSEENYSVLQKMNEYDLRLYKMVKVQNNNFFKKLPLASARLNLLSTFNKLWIRK